MVLETVLQESVFEDMIAFLPFSLAQHGLRCFFLGDLPAFSRPRPLEILALFKRLKHLLVAVFEIDLTKLWMRFNGVLNGYTSGGTAKTAVSPYRKLLF